MATQATIREARLEDAPAIATLVTQLGYPVGAQEMGDRLKRLLARTDHVLFVAESSAGIVGLVGAYQVEALEFSGRYGRLTGMVVDENWRGLGLGRQLMDWMEAWLSGQGIQMLILLWYLAVTWYSNRLTVESRRPGPDEMVQIFAAAGLEGSFWDPKADQWSSPT